MGKSLTDQYMIVLTAKINPIYAVKQRLPHHDPLTYNYWFPYVINMAHLSQNQ